VEISLEIFSASRVYITASFARFLDASSLVLYPVYTIQQTSSKFPANAFKIHVLIAGRLLDRVNGVLMYAVWCVETFISDDVLLAVTFHLRYLCLGPYLLSTRILCRILVNK